MLILKWPMPRMNKYHGKFHTNSGRGLCVLNFDCALDAKMHQEATKNNQRSKLIYNFWRMKTLAMSGFIEVQNFQNLYEIGFPIFTTGTETFYSIIHLFVLRNSEIAFDS